VTVTSAQKACWPRECSFAAHSGSGFGGLHVARQPIRPGLHVGSIVLMNYFIWFAIIDRTWLTASNASKEPCVQQRRSISRIDALNRLGAGEFVDASRDETYNPNWGGL
jgi:hypothetical protein